MVWRETVHFFQARSIVILIERGATIARAIKSIRGAEDVAARGTTGKTLRPQGGELEGGIGTAREGLARRAHHLGEIIATRRIPDG
jgi:hypothetical protein